ncbi:unnamed protein product [Menidia menidia]|uniref:(Atlantic silverside) hypothetical protein n=1 Tax=Menidia menidia TaxID=238744 RepID=A0A8S4ASA0_9TELE|nr:unnamed protein product [Menidia menidia]
MERFKETRVARSLNTIEDMHSRLQSNMEAIGMLNQQLNIICRENKRLRRQLEEERSTRRRVKHQIPRPSTSQHCFFIHPPPPHLNSVCPPTSSSSSSPSFLGLLHPLSTEPVAGDTWDLNSK